MSSYTLQLLVILLVTQINYNQALPPEAVNSNAPTDTFYIRHGRSKVRHSNEKEHILRTWRTQNANITHNYAGNSINENETSDNGRADFTSSISIPSGNGHLFGTGYWQHSESNDTITKRLTLTEPNATLKPFKTEPHATATVMSNTVTTMAPVTHKIRKLHKKKIMESIRNSVDKSLGIRFSNHHRSLAQAEQLQGRHIDLKEDKSNSHESNELSDGLQLADTLNLYDSLNDEDMYQNDEYFTTTAMDLTVKTENVNIAAAISEDLTLSTLLPALSLESEILNDDYKQNIEPETSTVGTMKATTVAQRDTKHATAFSGKPISVAAMENFEMKNKKSNHAGVEGNKSLVVHEPKNKNEFSSELTENAQKYSESDLIARAVQRPDTIETKWADSMQHTVSENGSEFENVPQIPAAVGGFSSEAPAFIAPTEADWYESLSLGPSQSASTSVGGVGLDRQSMDMEEINFDDVGLNVPEDGIMDDGLFDNSNANGFPVSSNNDNNDEYSDEVNPFLAGAVDAANEDEIYNWDEISRNNRRNLMRGRDVVTKFLQIVETQHSLGSNCEAGTSLNLGEGVVDRYAQDRFRVEAEVAVNRANMLTRIFKMTGRGVQSDINLLHASVLSMVEFDDDIFAAGNCFDWNEHPTQPGLFCPFAYRLPPPNLGAILAKNLATEYHYLGNTSEWFFQARKNAEKVIARNEQYLKAFHLYTNKTDERIEDDTLAVKYEDGRWSKPYYDCGGGNIWMLTYTVPFFGYENDTYHFKGTSGIDIDLRRVDIDQCPQRNTPGTTQPLNIFAGTDKCKQRTTMCEALKGLGFRRGSYKCICRKGFYFPDIIIAQKFFNGSLLEEEYEKLMLGKNSTYNIINEYECLPCAEGCDSCEDSSPCIAALNWPMRTSILVLACTVIGLLPPAAWFTFRYQQVKVVRAASPALLRVIALGAFFIYCTNIVMYPNPSLYTCTARIWLREIGFSLTYGALMLKTWRISVIFRVRSAKAVKITDAALLKRLGIICGVIGTCLLVRTLVSPPDVVVGRTADDLKAFLCKTDWWDYTFTSMEVLFLAWGVRLCIMVRKAPSEFNESRFISMAIYNEFLLTCFLNVSMLFLQSPANPDLLYIIFFCHTQLTVTLLLALIFGSKVYIVLRSGKSHQENIALGAKASGAKFNFRPQVRTFANPSSVTTTTAPVIGTSGDTKLSDQEALEEIRQLSVQLQRIQEMAPPKGVAVMTISSLLDGLKTPGGIMMVAAAATQASTAGNQLVVRQEHHQVALPLLALNTEIQKYNQQMQTVKNKNVNNTSSKLTTTTVTKSNAATAITTPTVVIATPTKTQEYKVVQEEKSTNTHLSGDNFQLESAMATTQGHIICNRCLETTKGQYYTCRPHTPPKACQLLGSPNKEGSISFANIKLDCMCSQPDDLDLTPRRRTNVRSAATNTPPSTSSNRKHGSTKFGNRFENGSTSSLHDASEVNVNYRICDNCRSKFSKKSSKRISNIRNSSRCSKSSKKEKRNRLIGGGDKSTQKQTTMTLTDIGGITQAQSTDLLERKPSALAENVVASQKKMRSTDDIVFYSTTDDSSDTPDNDDNDHITDTFISQEYQTTVECEIFPEGTLDSILTSGSTDLAMQPSTSSIGTTSVRKQESGESAAVTQTSLGNVSTNSNNSSQGDGNNASNSKTNGNGRSKRPDKLMLDLNDRSKYTKEVSV